MIAFKHFIITQFNIRLWDKDKRNISTYTEEWLAKRFGLFDLYCFPSVKQQTNPHFIWICLFDANTPEKYKEKIKDYQKQCPQLKACFLNSEDTLDWLGYAKNAILQHIDPQDEYIVTTNLDNDDAIHLHTIDSISSHINKNPEEVLYSFNLGYQYFTEPRILLKMVYPHNHFLSLVEKNSPDFKTIKCMPHAKARKHFKTIDIKDEPFWIEFVHSSNVNNDLRITSRIKYYPVFREVSFRNFGLDIVITKKTSITNTLIKMPLLFSTIACKKLKRKIAKKED